MNKIGLIILLLIPKIFFGQDLNKFFDDSEVKGVISIYDYQQKEWIHSDSLQASIGTLPASTFKIINTLIGLEEKVISGKNDTIRWDGEPKYFKTFKISNWNKDNTLEMAFKNSTIWYYEAIASELNKSTYKRHLKRNQYSNRKIKKGKGNDFWNYGKMKVSPIEQIHLLLGLYKNKLSFSPVHQELTKELMIEKETEAFTLRAKTGWCYDKKDIGWYIGYVEIKDNVIFFATRIEKELDKDNPAFPKLRKSITYDILNQLYSINLN